MKPNRLLQGRRLALAGGLAIAVGLTAAEPTSKRAEMQWFMRQKLAYSQGILEGMALEKFDVISRNAIWLRDMSQTNTWQALKNPDYIAHMKRFQKNVEALYMAAVDKNLDAATDAYARLARNCVECHRLVRREQRKNEPLPPAPGGTAVPDRF